MKYRSSLTSVGAVLVAAVSWMVSAAPAIALPSVGDGCVEAQLNNTVGAGDAMLRCTADAARGYIWTPDTSELQDPWVAGQLAWDACHSQGYSDAQCRNILATGGPVESSPPQDGRCEEIGTPGCASFSQTNPMQFGDPAFGIPPIP